MARKGLQAAVRASTAGLTGKKALDMGMRAPCCACIADFMSRTVTNGAGFLKGVLEHLLEQVSDDKRPMGEISLDYARCTYHR